MKKIINFDWIGPIKANLIMFKIVGLWPPGEQYGYNIYTLYTVFPVILLIFAHVLFSIVQIWIVAHHNVRVFVPVLLMGLTQILSFLKTCFFMKNVKKVKRIMKCLSQDIFQPKSEEQEKKIKRAFKNWQTVGIFYTFLAYFTVTIYFIGPIITKSTKNYRLPLSVWYPYDIKKSPNYELTYLYQILAYYSRATTTVSVDTFICALNTYIQTQCILLCDNLRNQKFEKNALHEVKRLISHHKEIVSLAKNANTFSNWIILCQFFSSLIATALSMFSLSLAEPFSDKFYAVLLHLSLLTSEIFMLCWFGNEVEIKSSQIPYSAFESDWTGIPIEAKKNLLIFIMRAQKPIKMSAINLFSLSLATFTTILRTSWSYFAVLRQVNAQD